MNTQLNQKEIHLLKELKGQETLCIEKYNKGAQCAVDGQLKGYSAELLRLSRSI